MHCLQLIKQTMEIAQQQVPLSSRTQLGEIDTLSQGDADGGEHIHWHTAEAHTDMLLGPLESYK